MRVGPVVCVTVQTEPQHTPERYSQSFPPPIPSAHGRAEATASSVWMLATAVLDSSGVHSRMYFADFLSFTWFYPNRGLRPCQGSSWLAAGLALLSIPDTDLLVLALTSCWYVYSMVSAAGMPSPQHSLIKRTRYIHNT